MQILGWLSYLEQLNNLEVRIVLVQFAVKYCQVGSARQHDFHRLAWPEFDLAFLAETGWVVAVVPINFGVVGTGNLPRPMNSRGNAAARILYCEHFYAVEFNGQRVVVDPIECATVRFMSVHRIIDRHTGARGDRVSWPFVVGVEVVYRTGKRE